MRAVLASVSAGGRAFSYGLGILACTLALAAAITSIEVADIADWALDVFGVTFLVVYGGLSLTVLFCWTRQYQSAGDPVARHIWLTAGLHAAGGVATVALTYTLLGISLGIGSLAGHELGPDTIQPVIRDLTRHFSMAFLTTVVGLPVSAVLRAMLMVTARRIETAGAAPTILIAGDES
jgi:hypothetical protein